MWAPNTANVGKSALAFVVISCVLLSASDAESYNILGIFPHPGVSHFYFFKPLLKDLAKAGHDVTVLSYFPEKHRVENYTEIILHESELMFNVIDLKHFEKSPSPFSTRLDTFYMIQAWGMQACDKVFKSAELQLILSSNKKFDVLIVEQFNNDCMMAVAYLLKVPVVALSSCAIMPWHYRRMGSPFTPSFMPVNFLGHSDEMGMLERTKNFLYFHAFNYLYEHETQPTTNKLIQRYFGSDVPSVEVLIKNTRVMLINQHYSITGVKPYSPSVVEIGGLQIEESQIMDEDLKDLLDSSENGVIYISWGSMIRADSLAAEKREAIVEALSQFKETILWKWENDTLPNRPPNVHIRSWMPQKEVLCHPNVKVFMTHGGLLGGSEAAYCGVPVVVTPIFGDQFLNSEAMRARRMAVVLPFHDINRDNVARALSEALSPSFQENAKAVSHDFRNRPVQPLPLARWWVEHVAKTGGSPLTASLSSDMSWLVYHSFDVYFVFIFTFLSIFYILKFGFKFAYKKVLYSKDSGKLKIN